MRRRIVLQNIGAVRLLLLPLVPARMPARLTRFQTLCAGVRGYQGRRRDRRFCGAANMEDGAHTGVAATVRCALHLEELGALALNIGHNAIAPEENCRQKPRATISFIASCLMAPAASTSPQHRWIARRLRICCYARGMTRPGGIPWAAYAAPWNSTGSKPCTRARSRSDRRVPIVGSSLEGEAAEAETRKAAEKSCRNGG